MPPKVTVYCITFNEEKMLPWFISYYGSWADKLVFFDNQSTDTTRSIIEACPIAEYHEYDSSNQIRDDLYLEIKNEKWKKYRGVTDWHIVVDTDEFLVHKTRDIKSVISECNENEYDVMLPEGYQMFSEEFPEYDSGSKLFNIITTGTPSQWYSKMVGFSNDRVYDINYSPGCHWAAPMILKSNEQCCTDSVKIFKDPDLLLLHFKYVHSESYLKSRVSEYASRLSSVNKKNGWAWQYENWKYIQDERAGIKQESKQIF